MALNFTVSYTFSPSTTISSSQVNTNTSDVASVFQGLEAETKTLAKLKMDIDPTIALEVATKQYVDHYSTWRRPVLQFGSITTIAVESGLDGTSGDIPMQFPDGTIRTETSTTRTTFNITRNAVLVTSGAQSGLTGATSEAANTWYALYAVKVTDSSSLWVTVGSTVLPLQANFTTLNTAYGANGWVYLGLVRNGDNSGATSDLLDFIQTGNFTMFKNSGTGNVLNGSGVRLATSASATSITYSYSAGTGTTDIPNNSLQGVYLIGSGPGTGTASVTNSGGTESFAAAIGTGNFFVRVPVRLINGAKIANSSGVGMDIFLSGFYDQVLGVGSNPLL